MKKECNEIAIAKALTPFYKPNFAVGGTLGRIKKNSVISFQFAQNGLNNV